MRCENCDRLEQLLRARPDEDETLAENARLKAENDRLYFSREAEREKRAVLEVRVAALERKERQRANLRKGRATQKANAKKRRAAKRKQAKEDTETYGFPLPY